MPITQKKIGPDDVWASIYELSQQQKETERLFREQRTETERLFREQRKETEILFRETDKQIKETDRQLREKFSDLKDYVGGIGQNNGDVAETYFYQTIADTMKIGDLDFDMIETNVKRKNCRQNLEGEYDIILTNSNSIALLEIKYKLHPNDIKKLVNKKIPVFKKLFPEKKEYKLYIGVAALTIPDDSRRLALDYGFFVLTQGAGKIKLEHDVIKTY